MPKWYWICWLKSCLIISLQTAAGCLIFFMLLKMEGEGGSRSLTHIICSHLTLTQKSKSCWSSWAKRKVWRQLGDGGKHVSVTSTGQLHPHQQSLRRLSSQSIRHFSTTYWTNTPTYLIGCSTSVLMESLPHNVCGWQKVLHNICQGFRLGIKVVNIVSHTKCVSG